MPTQVVAVWLALFTTNGQGLAAALAIRVRGDGSQTADPVYRSENGAVTADFLDLGPASDRVYLTLFGTGIRAAGGRVSVTVAGLPAQVSYSGPQGTLSGEDQVNVLLPREIAGRGVVPIVVTAAGYTSNTVYIAVP